MDTNTPMVKEFIETYLHGRYTKGKDEATDVIVNMLSMLERDKMRLDWLLENKRCLGPEQCLKDCKHAGNAKSYQLIYTRKTIDEEMRIMTNKPEA